MRFCYAVIVSSAILLGGFTHTVAGQQRGPGPQSALTLGPSVYDLSGVGTAFALNLSSASRLAGRALLLEPNLGYFTYTTQFGTRRHHIFPELGVQLQAHLDAVRPYLGGGIGMGIDTKGGPSQLDFTLHGAAGLRVQVSGQWGARVELRVRSVDPFHGNTTDIGFGITRGRR